MLHLQRKTKPNICAKDMWARTHAHILTQNLNTICRMERKKCERNEDNDNCIHVANISTITTTTTYQCKSNSNKHKLTTWNWNSKHHDENRRITEECLRATTEKKQKCQVLLQWQKRSNIVLEYTTSNSYTSKPVKLSHTQIHRYTWVPSWV